MVVEWGDRGPRARDVETHPRAAGYRTVERYRVLPTRSSARFLVPGGPRAAASRSLTGYNRLRPPRVRAARALAALSVRSGAGRLLGEAALTVRIHVDVPPGAEPEHLLLAHLARELRAPGLVASVGVHRPDPNHKPTLQLADGAGAAVGYAKVGWNEPTRELVRNEARALLAQADRPGRRALRVPRLLARGTWRDRELAVVEPLPRDAARWAPERVAVTPLRDVVGEVTVVPLQDSPWWRSLVEQVGVEPDDRGEREAVHRLRCLAREVEGETGSVPLPVGTWHGDWVPWNLARSDDGVHAFDWEHSADGVPVGFDVLHWAFQCEVVLSGRSVRHGCDAVDAAVRRGWHELVPHAPHPRAGTLYLMEMALRTMRLHRSGGSWNPRLHPGLWEVLQTRRR